MFIKRRNFIVRFFCAHEWRVHKYWTDRWHCEKKKVKYKKCLKCGARRWVR